MKMRLMLLAAVAATLALCPAVRAADFPVKAVAPVWAPLPATCAPQNCSGWYVGGGVSGTGSNADIIGSGINQSIFSEGVTLKAQGGYQFWNGSVFAAIDVSAGYQFSTPNSAGALVTPNGSKFVGTELVKLGYNFFPQATSATVTPGQSPSLLTVPANLLASSTPYLTVGGMQRYGKTVEVNGAGVQTVIAKGWSTDVKYLYAAPQQGLPATQVVTLELNRHF